MKLTFANTRKNKQLLLILLTSLCFLTVLMAGCTSDQAHSKDGVDDAALPLESHELSTSDLSSTGGSISESTESESNSSAQNNSLESSVAGEGNYDYIVYFFHGHARCFACLTIEEFTVRFVNSDYADLLDSGKLKLQVINIQEMENEHFARDYELTEQSVVIVRNKDGQRVYWKKLQGVWEYVYDESAFKEYLLTEINSILIE